MSGALAIRTARPKAICPWNGHVGLGDRPAQRDEAERCHWELVTGSRTRQRRGAGEAMSEQGPQHAPRSPRRPCVHLAMRRRAAVAFSILVIATFAACGS